MKFCRFLSVVVALALLAAALAPARADVADRIVIQLKWRHQFQFAGYYAAIEQGYVSITPLTIDMTAYSSLVSLGAWLDLQG